MSDPKLVLMAAISTLAMTLALTLYAFTTTKDITMYGSTLFILSCALFIFGIFALLTQNKIMSILYNVAAIIFYGYYLVYDT